MCFCGNCFFGYRKNCPGTRHRHAIDETILHQQANDYLQRLFTVCDNEKADESCKAYLRRYAIIDILRANEAISTLENIGRPQSDDPFYAFANTLYKQTKTEFSVEDVRFHYAFDATSDIHGLLNNYLKMAMNICEGNRIIRLAYKEDNVFRAIGASVNEGEFSLLKRARYTDYFIVFFRDAHNEINVILFDLACVKAHVMCAKADINDIVNLMKANDITLSAMPTKLSFEGTVEATTSALLFKPFMMAYLNNEILASKFVVLGPDKSVNDYVFYESYHETDGEDDKPMRKTSEYVKFTIEPTRKVDMIMNVFKITFIGNNNDLIVPFIGALFALICKLENLHFTVDVDMDKGYLAIENEFIRSIQSEAVEVDRHVASFCEFCTCKKSTFSQTMASYKPVCTPDEFTERISSLPVNYRPLAIWRLYNRRLNETSQVDAFSLTRLACFYDSVEVNMLFTPDAPRTFSEPVYEVVINNERWDYHVRSTGRKRSVTNVVFPVFGEAKLVRKNITVQDSADVIILLDGERSMCFIECPCDGAIKGLIRGDDGLLRRGVDKPHDGKMTPVESNVNNVLMRYITTDDDRPLTNKPIKMIPFNTSLIGVAASFADHAINVLGEDGVNVLLSQHLWDHSQEERIRLLRQAINIEILQDLVQYIFDARVLYFVFDTKRNEYIFRPPRHNGWYAIGHTYERVMFIFMAKNGNLYTVLFECTDRAYIAYSVPVNCSPKLTSTYGEFNGLVPAVVDTVDMTKTPIGQLIDTYGKSVGMALSDGSQLRHAPQSPLMSPRQSMATSERTIRVKRIYLSARPVVCRQTIFAEYKPPLRPTPSIADVIDRDQHLSILMKAILKYAIIRMGDDVDVRVVGKLVEDIIVEREEDRPLTYDVIYYVVKMPPREQFHAFLTENFGSVFVDGRFRVKDAERTRLFIRRELLLMANASKDFYNDFVSADFNIDLVRQQPNEIVSERYLRHQATIESIKGRLSSRTVIDFVVNITPDVILEKRVLLVSIGHACSPRSGSLSNPMRTIGHACSQEQSIPARRAGHDYFLLVDTRRSEIEIAFFVCEQWRNHRIVADYCEDRTLTTAHDAYRLADGMITCMSLPNDDQTRPKVLYYENDRCRRFASLLPV